MRLTTDDKTTPLREAIQPLQNAALTAKTLADLYRRHDLSRGHQALNGLAGELRSLAVDVLTVSRERGIDLSADAGNGSLNDHIGNLVGVLDTLISAQASEDWLTAADILEYDVEPAIRQWAALLEKL
jgi:hypothetical protein